MDQQPIKNRYVEYYMLAASKIPRAGYSTLQELNAALSAADLQPVSEDEVNTRVSSYMAEKAAANAVKRGISTVDGQFESKCEAFVVITTVGGSRLQVQADAQAQLNIANAAQNFGQLQAGCLAAGLTGAHWIDSDNVLVPVTELDMQTLYATGFRRKVSLAVAQNAAKAALRAGVQIPETARVVLGVDANGVLLA